MKARSSVVHALYSVIRSFNAPGEPFVENEKYHALTIKRRLKSQQTVLNQPVTEFP
jgi:hypothetical protein